MAKYMKSVVRSNISLTVEERNLLSVAYKNVIGTKRAAWRVLSSLESKGKDPLHITSAYKQTIENELEETCKEVIDLLNTTLLANDDDKEPTHTDKDNVKEARVFYLKM